MAREDLARFCALNIDFEAIGLMEPGVEQAPYFCTPVGAEYVGRIGVDGIHFILLPGDERVFCVSPCMGEAGTFVLPVAEDFRSFLSYLLYCRGASPLEEIAWVDRAAFQGQLAAEVADRERAPQLYGQEDHALAALAETFQVEPADPYERVKALQAVFDPARLQFSHEYYDVLGLECP